MIKKLLNNLYEIDPAILYFTIAITYAFFAVIVFGTLI